MSFTLQQETIIPEINATAKVFIHDKTGARLLSLTNDDENKCFGINFRTPPADSTGIAHIMEHSVLCGSRKYPVKEPFVELIKGSLNTFLNAFTYPDKTCYPIASQNLKDFYNLIDVYLDAVFYPLIPPETLQQEGWHYELDSPDAPLTYKGVVFNEMKGNYSSPDGILHELSQHSVFPDNLYRFDSGGDPAAIPDLTYAQFKDFHDTYYHPSNAYIYFYGDDPEDERLRLLETWLEAFDRKEIDALVPLQPRFSAPRSLGAVYDSGDNADATPSRRPFGKAYLQLNWMMPEVTDVQTTLGLDLLSHILLATPASPLKKVLTESGLGEDVTGGYQQDYRQALFSAGMKGIVNEDTEKVEKLILETLAALAKDGIDAETVAASLNTVEFQLRERNTGRFPRGLALMLGALGLWVYDGDPIAGLAFEAPLAAVKAKIAAGRYFESLIEEHLLNNPHRTSLTLRPDPEEGKRRANAELIELEKIKESMSPADFTRVIAEARELKRRQEAPDSPEALATLPALSLADIDPKIKTIPIRIFGRRADDPPPVIFYHPLFTNNILYLDLGFDLHSLPTDLLPYAGLFGRLLLEMGTASDDFVRLTQRIGRDTGGIRPSSLISSIRESERSAAWLFLRGKAVASQSAALLEILKDILLTARFDNPERFKQIVLEEKSGMEAGLLPGGHMVVNRRLRARFNEADWVSEQLNGLDQLFFLRELVETIEKDWASVLDKLETVRRLLVNRAAMIVNVTLDESNWKSFSPILTSFLGMLPVLETVSINWLPAVFNQNEGLTISSQVNYVAKGANLYKLGYRMHGSVQVINKILGTTWLWEKIRVQGGAYGGFSAFDIHSGAYTFLSYRDPNLLASLDTYDATASFLRDLELSDAELTKAIIGTIGDLDAYLLPDAKGWSSMNRYLIGYSDEKRQKFRDEVLSTTARNFKSFGETLQALAQHGQIVVLGSADAIEKANAERKGLLEVKKVL
jgi:Zn-dependent M16 (insulinase) family peptidase